MPDQRQYSRHAFMLTLRPGMGAAYDESHKQVWPEMLDLLKRSGIREYSIFRREEILILVLSIAAKDTFDEVWDRIAADPINTRWQAAMTPYFAPIENLRLNERFPMLQEVFYLP